MNKLVSVLFTVLLMTGFVFGESVPSTVSYQGLLTASDGSPATGMFDMIVRIYDDSTGGQLLGEHGFPTVPVSNGQFRLLIPSFGSIADPNPTSSDGEATRFLEVEVEGEAILPRTRLSSTPFSIQSHSLAGDIYTSPGRLYMVPNGPPVTDCTYFPLELAVDSLVSRFRMKPLISPTDCTYFPLEFRVDANSTQMHFHPPDPINPLDSIEPAVAISVDPTQARLYVMGVEPQPFKTNRADHRDADISLQSDVVLSAFTLQHAGNGVEQPPSLRMSTGIGTGLEIVGFNPQPEPPHPLFSINASPENGLSIRGFNPQPEPPSPEDPTLLMNGGLGDTGPGIFMFNPQPEPPGTPPFLLGMQTTPIGAMFEMQSEPGVAKAAGGGINRIGISTDSSDGKIRLSNTTPAGAGAGDSMTAELSVSALSGSELRMDYNTSAGIIPCVRVFNDGLASGLSGFDTKVGVTGSNDSALANLMVDGDVGSSLQLDYKLATGINPCVRVFSQDAEAGLSIFGATPPDNTKSPGGFAEYRGADSRTADSSVINLIADTGRATIELFGGTSGADASIVLISNNTGGRVGVNTNNPSEALQVVGNICATGTIGACSDERYKKNIETIGDALGIIEQLRGVDFKWRVDEFPEKQFATDEQVGFIAQEIAEVLPEVVSKGSDGYYSVDYARLTPILVEAIKDQQKQIDELTVLVKQLVSRLEPQPATEYGSK